MPRAQLHDLELYYETAGSGRPIVLINSWGTTLRVWDQVTADLSADHQVVTYDWRGCGRSDRTAQGNTIDQNAADLLALVEYLDLDRPVLVGSSVGSLFALAAARTTADRIRGVVVVDGPGHCDWMPNLADVLHAQMRNLAADRAAAVAASVKNMYTDRASDELRAWTARQILDASPHIDVLFDEQTTYDPRPWLPEIVAPILYIHGSLDQAVPLHVPEEMASLTTGSAVITINGAGHLAHQEQPAQVADAIRAFSKTHDPGFDEPRIVSHSPEPKQVLQRYLDALVTGDADTIRDSFAEDATWTVKADLPIAGPWHGRDQIVDDFLSAVMAERFQAGSHVFTFPTMIADGNTIALEWHVSARNAAGEPYENDYCGIFVIRNGKITAVREYLDSHYAANVLFSDSRY
jgi:pimeloyl-ACP methyl ester carboxylesterase/ketosteroid isomerase-like protein